MMKKFSTGIATTLVALYFSSALTAQKADTTLTLPEFSVSEKRMHFFNAGSTVSHIDTSYLQRNAAASLGDILQNNTSLHVDAYGVGSTSISARGLGAKRTPVIWNGFNLQGVNGHDVDVAAIQGFMVDNIHIETGSSSALFGSGAAGGIVYIDNKPLLGSPDQTRVNLSMGSFGRYMGGSSVRWGNNGYKSTVRLFYEAADNDFPYTADYTKGKSVTHVDTTQVNAARHQVGLMSDNIFRINRYQSLSVHFWFQDIDRQIAPTVKDVVGKKTVDAKQADEVYRSSAQWNYGKGIWNAAVRSALLSNQIRYTRASSPESNTKTEGNSWISEAEATCAPIEQLALNLGVHYNMEDCRSTSYGSWHNRTRTAMFASARFNNEPSGTKATLNARLEAIEGDYCPATWNIGIEQSVWGPLSTVAKAGTSYRVASFNDLYWNSSTSVGNPDLKPEEGINYEGGLQWKSRHGHLYIEASASGYTMEMKNWMSWAPREDGKYTVMNLDSAHIEGIETQGSLTFGNAESNISVRGAYTYTDARDPKTDNRLPYVPMHKGTLSVMATAKGYQLMAGRTESSKLACNAANSEYVRGYIVYDCGLYKNLVLPSATFNVGLKVQNLTDKQYQVRQNYPMPGRQYMLTLAIKI